MSQYAFVTGAAKGIGKAIAGQLAAKNYNLLLTDIDEQALIVTTALIREQFKIQAYFLVADLSKKDAIQKIWKWTLPFHDKIKIVVNNAGYGLNAPFTARTLQDHLDLINVNIGAVVSLSHLFIPVLNRHEKAWLLNVGSTTAYQTVPYLNTYASSKAFVLSFTRGLRKELQHSNISVSCLSPGSTDTDFVNRASMSDKTKKLAEQYNMTSEEVADIAVKGLFKGTAEIVPGLANKIHAYFTKFFPKSLVENIAARIYKPQANKDTFLFKTHTVEEEDFLPV